MTKEDIDKLRLEHGERNRRQEESQVKLMKAWPTPDRQLINIAQYRKNIFGTENINELNQRIADPYYNSLSEEGRLKYNYEKSLIEYASRLEKMNNLPKSIPTKHNLNYRQLTFLFDQLQINGYISQKTPLDICAWLFGADEKPYNLCELYINHRQKLGNSQNHFNPFDENFEPYVIKKIKDKPIQWIKCNSTTHEIYLNKKALLDLLNQLGVPYSYWCNKNNLKCHFVDRMNNAIIFNGQNYKEFKKTDMKSECHEEIRGFIEQAKQLI